MYEINKEIVFSTAHVVLKTAEYLTSICDGEDPFANVVVSHDDYCYRILVPQDPELREELENFELADLRKLFVIAINNDCKWLVLDPDGPIYENLEKFDW